MCVHVLVPSLCNDHLIDWHPVTMARCDGVVEDFDGRGVLDGHEVLQKTFTT